MNRIIYLAELFKHNDWEAIFSTAANDYSRVNNIYYFDLSVNLDSYWVTTWGGTFDNVTSVYLQILFNSFLTEVFTSAALKLTENSFFVDGQKVYMNLPFDPWQYFKQFTEVLVNDEDGSFSSAVGDTTNPSDWTFKTDKVYKPTLVVPSVPNKLSQPISGLSLATTFNFNVLNNDGALDDAEDNNFFNTKTKLKKTTVENPSFSDFKVIRAGLVESVDISFSNFGVKIADYERFFTVGINRKFTTQEFPSLPTDLENTSIPSGWNELENVELIQVSGGFNYIAIDPKQISTVTTVYGSDGNSISFTELNGIITTSAEAATADIIGTVLSLGDIIVFLINEFSFLKYLPENWDIVETDSYISDTQFGGIYFQESDLKEAVNSILKNNLGFLISKNDGRLTLRSWGTTYDSHDIDSWNILNADKLKKDYKDAAKYYMSSCSIKYAKDISNDKFKQEYVDSSREGDIFSEFRKSKVVTYECDFENNAGGLAFATELASTLLDRFGAMKPIIKVDLGYDTTDINLLDTVNLEFVINGRVFIGTSDFIVREVDPAQDVLLLESIGNVKVEGAILDNFEFAILDNNEFAIMGVE